MSQYDRTGAFHCDCGREHRLGTRKILLGDGVIGQLPDHLRDWHGATARLWVLSDENTENAAGRRCKQLVVRLPFYLHRCSRFAPAADD